MNLIAIFAIFFMSAAYFVDSASTAILDATVQIPTNELIAAVHKRGEEELLPSEIITNGSFLDGFSFWQQEGVVTLQSDCYEENSCVVLGSPNEPAIESFITQEFTVSEQQPSGLSFVISTTTSETLPGFDSPHFVIFLDDTPIYVEHFSPELPINQWREVTVPLPYLEPDTHQLKFLQQNTGDDAAVPVVSLAKITTNTVLLGANDSLVFQQQDGMGTIKLELQSPTENKLITAEEPILLSPTDLEAYANVNYWWEKADRTASKPIELSLHTNQIPPGVAEIVAAQVELDNTLTLKINKPVDSYRYKLQFANQQKVQAESIVLEPANTFMHTDVINTLLPEEKSYDRVRLQVLDTAGNTSLWTDYFLLDLPAQ